MDQAELSELFIDSKGRLCKCILSPSNPNLILGYMDDVDLYVHKDRVEWSCAYRNIRFYGRQK